MKNVDLRKYFNIYASFGQRCKSYEQGKTYLISFSFEEHTLGYILRTYFSQRGMVNTVLQ